MNFNINKYIELPKNKNLAFIFFIFCVIILSTIFTVKIYNKENYKKDIIRLHVVANSNNVDDQLTKLKISTKIEDYLNSLNLNNLNDKNEVLNDISKHSDNILEIANSTLKDDNKEYEAKLNIGKIKYDEKQSLELDMEQGIYDSVQIVLGDGNGKNFWSLIFPNKDNIDKLKNYETILPGISNIYNEEENKENENDTQSENKITYSFKGLELLEKISNLLNKSHQ